MRPRDWACRRASARMSRQTSGRATGCRRTWRCEQRLRRRCHSPRETASTAAFASPLMWATSVSWATRA
eukprot:493319-Pleurochrysis_carterae.AAC.1